MQDVSEIAYCVRNLSDKIKLAREQMGYTQRELAIYADISERTVVHAENYDGNPVFQNLYALIRTLKIDANEIFYPEGEYSAPALHSLHALVNECSEIEAETLYPVFDAMLKAIRKSETTSIK